MIFRKKFISLLISRLIYSCHFRKQYICHSGLTGIFSKIDSGQAGMTCFIKGICLIAVLLTTVPVSAHDLPIGGSRWCFGKNNIVGNIDLKIPLLMEIKGIKEGHYNLESISDNQLHQIAADILQPYINKKLSITVDDKKYPVKVTKLVSNENNLYTIWLSVENISFKNPENQVKIVYSLLFEETKNEHINLAYGYLTDATGDALQAVFQGSSPLFQSTFDYNNQVWQLSVKGTANAPAAEHKTESPVASSSSGKIKDIVSNKNAVVHLKAAGPAPKDAQVRKKSGTASAAGSTKSSIL